MRFLSTELNGAKLIELENIEDDRGFFARSFCSREFEAHGLNPRIVQCNVSYNAHRGTLRGMHFQREPHAEAKLVRCTRGAIYDVILDLQPQSFSYQRWYAVELTADNGRALYVPPGFAHGFQTLSDGCDVSYQMSEFYVPEAGGGVRWNDPAFAIAWPIANPIVSSRDASYPDYRA